jgi:hypothetical protein
VGAERGQPESGIWTRAADSYPAQPGQYRPRRAKPGPPDPYLPRSEDPLRSGPYVQSGTGSASERFGAPRPDPLRDPFPADPAAPPDPAPPPDLAASPDPTPARGGDGQRVPGGPFGWWNTNGNFATDRRPPGREPPAAPQPSAWDQAPERAVREHGGRDQPARNQAVRDQPAREQAFQDQPVRARPARDPVSRNQPAPSQPAWERAFQDQPVQERPARSQAVGGQPARNQAAEWYTGRQEVRDEPIPDRPLGARGGPADSHQADADRYPADFPTQVFMSSAQAAWQQPAQPAPAGNWPRIAEPAPPAGQPQPAGPRRDQPAGPPGRHQPSDPPGPRRAPALARPAEGRHATARSPSRGGHPGWDQGPAAGPEQQYPAAAARRAAADYLAAPFPPAPDPAELYPAVYGPAQPAGRPPARSRPSASKSRGVRGGLLVAAAFLVVLIAVALIVFVALPR